MSGCLHPVLAVGLRRHAWLLQRLPDFAVALRIAWQGKFIRLPPEELLELQRMAELAGSSRRGGDCNSAEFTGPEQAP